MPKIIISDVNPETKTISIALDTIVKKDGKIVSKSRNRRAFVPGDIEEVKKYLGVSSSPEVTYLESLWTKAVIDAYKASVSDG